MTDYHKAHEPYIAAVAAAFDAAGITSLDHYADPNDPRDGAIQLDPAKCGTWAGYEQVWVGWQEERGWTAVPYARRNGAVEAVFVEDLDLIALVASPTTVVSEFCDKVGVEWAGQPNAYPDVDFPEHVQEDEENPAFEAALAVYAEVPNVG